MLPFVAFAHCNHKLKRFFKSNFHGFFGTSHTSGIGCKVKEHGDQFFKVADLSPKKNIFGNVQPPQMGFYGSTLPETNIAPKNGWLEY